MPRPRRDRTDPHTPRPPAQGDQPVPGEPAAPGDRPAAPRDFIREIIEADNRSGRFGGRVHTRFPPEPNGHLHIGHAKSICLNYGIARDYGGKFNLRMDDTNPEKEEEEYVRAIIEDVRWLGADWEDRLCYGSDYFDRMYAWAVELIKAGKAYVCDLTPEQVSAYRGTLTQPGRPSPARDRPVEENLALFERMRGGDFPDGSHTLRARIDMAHPNIIMRDPILYRILHTPHHRQGDRWCIYPTYDWAHGFEDSIEGITHSICTLEFEIHRPLYDWFLEQVNVYHPRQIEFARLNLTYTVMSKRRLLELVRGGHVRGWDDPRMPTISGLRRRGYTAEAIWEFCRRIGVSKTDSVVDIALLEHCVREHLNKVAPRVMGVLRPLKLIIDNYPAGQVEQMTAVNNPEDPAAGTRTVPFGRELYIEQDDFRQTPPPKYWRLFPGNEVRLRYAYFVRCTGFEQDPRTGRITAVHCTYDPATRGGDSPDGRKVKSTLHWVSAAHALPVEVRLYNHLFTRPDPDEVNAAEPAAAPAPAHMLGGGARATADAASSSDIAEAGDTARAAPDWKRNLNPDSLEVLQPVYVEPSVALAPAGARFQFERLGYFCVDPDSDPVPAGPPDPNCPDPSRGREGAVAGPASAGQRRPDSVRRLVFNRTVTLKDEWARLEKKL